MKVSERYKWKGIGRKILLALLAVILLVIFVSGNRGLLKWNQLRRRCEVFERQNYAMELEIQEVSARIRGIEEGDSLELERAARFWGMVHPNEEIFIIRQEGDTLSSPAGGPP